MAATPTKKAKKTTTRRSTSTKKAAPKTAKKPTVKKTTRTAKKAEKEPTADAPKRKRTTRAKAEDKKMEKTTNRRSTRASKTVTAEEKNTKTTARAAKKSSTRATKSTIAGEDENTTQAKKSRSRKKADPTVAAEAVEVVDSANLSEQFTEENAGDAEVTIDRRKKGNDRRKKVKAERPKIERRAKVNRRRQIDPTTCERDYSVDEIEFMNALELYKRENGRPFPTCSEVLEVIRSLGYQKPIAGELVDLKDDRESPFAELPSNDLEERLSRPNSSWIDRIGDRDSTERTHELISNS